MLLGKNESLPSTYRDFPYQYIRTGLCTVLQKNDDEVYIFGDDETLFFRECNRAKQHSRSLSSVIDEYFIN